MNSSITTGGRQVPLTREQLARTLTTDYLGADAAGTLLPSERVLCDRFGVSRPFVREVLSGLQERGLIEIVPGRGAFVRGAGMLDVAKVMGAAFRRRAVTPRDLMAARSMLEQETAAHAARNASPDELAAIGRALEAFEHTRDLISRARTDIAFHGLIARASGNPVLETMFGSIATLVFEIMLRSLGDPETVRRGAPYHQQVLTALYARDASAARAAMAAHLDVARHTYGPDMDQSLDVVAADAAAGLVGPSESLELLVADAIAEFAPTQ